MALPNKTKIPVGTVLAGKYRITREIGRGGMATVHEAENVDIGKRVAIKVLAQELTGSSIVVERFLREARAAAAIRSPYICDVYDSGKLEKSGQPFLVLELLEGESLYERMTRQRQLDIATTVAVISQVCRGLTKAHMASIVHRDLKPENIFLTHDEDGQLLAKILDFGLAKFYAPTTKDQTRLTRDGAVFGTPAYMSPEQVRGQGAVDHRADLWALGCITYECFTGKTVLSTDQGVAMTFAQIASAPRPRPARYRPDLPQGFTDWFDRTLDRDIGKRFQTAKEFAESLAASFGLERRETSEIRSSPVEARDEAAVALQGAGSPPSSARKAPPMSGRAPQPPPPEPSPEPSAADHYRPISASEEDLDPTRVLKKTPNIKQLAPGAPAPPDGKLERFRRTPDGRIAKVVPQVVPNSPAIPSRPPPTPVPGSQRPPVVVHAQNHGGQPPQRHAPAPPAVQHATPARARPTPVPPAPNENDSDIIKNPFASARRRRRIIVAATLVAFVLLVVVFVAMSSSSTPSSGSGNAATSSASGSSSGAPSLTTTAINTASPVLSPSAESPLPAWLSQVREAQAALTSGDVKGATAKLSEASTKSNGHGAPQGLTKQIAAAVFNRGTCALAAVARPRTYDLMNTTARRSAATRPSVLAFPNTTLVAWTDAHTGPSHAYLSVLDGAFALTGHAVDLTPDGSDVRSAEVFPWGDKAIFLYADAKVGTFARFLGSDGKPSGQAVQVGPAKSAQSTPVILGAKDRGLFVAWTEDGDRDSEDLFLQKLSMVTLSPEGTPSRITDLAPIVPSSSQRARALLPRGAVAKDALVIAFELERKPGSFIEQQTLAFADVGRELAPAGSNREGKAVGSLTLVNVDKSRAHAPQIACSTDICFVVWSGESPPGAQGVAFDLSSGKALWRRKFSPNAKAPSVAAAQSGGAVAAWVEDGKLVAASLGRAGFGRPTKLGRAQSQTAPHIVSGAEKGSFVAGWLDLEVGLAEPYVARLKCP